MRSLFNQRIFLVWGSAMLLCHSALSQLEQVQRVETAPVVVGPSGSITLALPPVVGSYALGTCTVWCRVRYQSGTETVTVKPSIVGPGTFPDLVVNAGKPEQIETMVWSSAPNVLGSTDVTLTYTSTGNSSAQISFGVVRSYHASGSVAAACTGLAPISQAKLTGSKQVAFTWVGDNGVRNWDLQLLRLVNKVPVAMTAPYDLYAMGITTPINWREATNYPLETPTPACTLTLSSGTGFYAWRVRSVVFDASGKAVYGNWNAGSLAETNTPGLMNSTTPVGQSAFYFEDPEAGLNTIYNRSFSEGNKVKETITYANGLQQTKQLQTRIPSNQRNVAIPTLYDFTGRNNTQQVLPIPLAPNPNAGLGGYVPLLVTPVAAPTELYTAKSFDGETNGRVESTPMAVKDDYYTNPGGSDPLRLGVAQADGYPFSRSIVANEPGGKVEEQRGVGARFNQQGATPLPSTLTNYSSCSEGELNMLFGTNNGPRINASQVYKTYTTDPNGTTSVSYILKNGKTLATSLVVPPVSGSVSDPVRLSVNGITPIGPNQVALKTGQNTFENGIIKAGKNLYLERDGEVIIDYKIQGFETLDINCVTLDPNNTYKLEVLVRSLDNDLPTLNAPPAGSGWIAPPPPNGSPVRTVVLAYGPEVGKTSVVPSWNLGNMPRGNYYIEKQITLVQSNISTPVDVETVNKEINPIVYYIKAWMDDAKCRQDFMQTFNRKMWDLKKWIEVNPCAESTCTTLVNGQYLNCLNAGSGIDRGIGGGDNHDIFPSLPSPLSIPPASGSHFDMSGFDFHSTTISFSPEGEDKMLQSITISTGCCGSITIPIDNRAIFQMFDIYSTGTNPVVTKRAVRLEPETGPGLKVNPYVASMDMALRNQTHFFPDFEGYAYAYFKDCVKDDDVNGWLLLKGYKPLLGSTINYNQIKNDFFNADTPLQYIDYDPHSGGSSILPLDEINRNIVRIAYVYDEILRPRMGGYEKAGTFNLMVNKMLTDNYTCDGYEYYLNAAGGRIEGGSPSKWNKLVAQKKPDAILDPCLGNGSLPVFPICTTATVQVPIPILTPPIPNPLPTEGLDGFENYSQYHITRLATCWMSMLAQMKQRANIQCIGEEPINVGAPGQNGSDAFDGDASGGDGEPGKQNEHVDGHIDLGWFMNWWMADEIEALSKQVRDAQDKENGASESLENEAMNLAALNGIHMVKDFLNCTGYRFAGIVRKVGADQITGLIAGESTTPPNSNTLVGTGNVRTFSGEFRNFIPFSDWKANVVTGPVTTNAMPNIPDPVYAFKYFRYDDGQRKDLELNTCYKDFNLNNDGSPRCTTATGGAVPCDFCGYGKIICPSQKDGWTCGQRFSFYEMLRKTPKPANDVTVYYPTGLHRDDFMSPGVRGGTGNDFSACTSYFNTGPTGNLNTLKKMAPVFYTWEYLANPNRTVPDKRPPGPSTQPVYDLVPLPYGEHFTLSQPTGPDGTSYRSGFQVVDREAALEGQLGMPTTPRDLKTKIELDIEGINRQVLASCSLARPKVRKDIQLALIEAGYIMGECKSEDGCPNVVTREDLDSLTSTAYRACLVRGFVNSFSIEERTCINLYTPPDCDGLPIRTPCGGTSGIACGDDFPEGTPCGERTNTYPHLEYGVVRVPDAANNPVANEYTDHVQSTETNVACTTATLHHRPSITNSPPNCSGQPPSYINDFASFFSNIAQYTAPFGSSLPPYVVSGQTSARQLVFKPNFMPTGQTTIPNLPIYECKRQNPAEAPEYSYVQQKRYKEVITTRMMFTSFTKCAPEPQTNPPTPAVTECPKEPAGYWNNIPTYQPGVTIPQLPDPTTGQIGLPNSDESTLLKLEIKPNEDTSEDYYSETTTPTPAPFKKVTTTINSLRQP